MDTTQILAVPTGQAVDIIAQLAARGLTVFLVSGGGAPCALPVPAVAPASPPPVVLPFKPHTVAAATQAALQSKRERGCRHRYILKLASALRIFGETFGERELHTITAEEVEKWMSNERWSNETRRGYLQCLRTLFSFAVKREWTAGNPAMRVDAPMSENKPPGILSVDDCAKFLAACRKHDAALLPFIAAQLFAGLRVSEACTLVWSEAAGGHVEVTAAKCKTRKRRLVPIGDTLRAWLALGGDLPAKSWRKRLDKVRIKSGVTLPKNALRHSFVSYAMPMHGASTTAAWAGHSESVLFNHYRAVVTKPEAERFWQLTPEEVEKAESR